MINSVACYRPNQAVFLLSVCILSSPCNSLPITFDIDESIFFDILPTVRDIISNTVQELELFGSFLDNRCFMKDIDVAGKPFSHAQILEDDLNQCLEASVPAFRTMLEVQADKWSGELKNAFHQYCRKRTVIQQCIDSYLTSMGNCWKDGKTQGMSRLQKISDGMSKLVCHMNRAVLEEFIFDGGFQCVEAHQAELEMCFQTVSKIRPDPVRITKITDDRRDAEECEVVKAAETCTINQLAQKCGKSKTLYFVEAMFNSYYSCHEQPVALKNSGMAEALPGYTEMSRSDSQISTTESSMSDTEVKLISKEDSDPKVISNVTTDPTNSVTSSVEVRRKDKDRNFETASDPLKVTSKHQPSHVDTTTVMNHISILVISSFVVLSVIIVFLIAALACDRSFVT